MNTEKISAATPFDVAFDILIRHEGGFVNDPHDRGGPTKYGITLRSLSEYRNRQATAEDVEALTLDIAKAFYKSTYWGPLKLDQIRSPYVALVLFDQAVLCGQKSAATKLQTSLGFSKPDGVMGPLTVAAVNKADGYSLAFDFLKISAASFLEFGAGQSRYVTGWINRLFNLAHEIAEMGDAHDHQAVD